MPDVSKEMFGEGTAVIRAEMSWIMDDGSSVGCVYERRAERRHSP